MKQERLARQQQQAEARLLRIGDVFTSPKLEYGYRDYSGESPVITVDGQPVQHVVMQYYPEQERLDHAAKTGEILPRTYETDYAAHDRSRAMAHFVVTRTEHPMGHWGMGGMDQGSPEEHRVWAQRLTTEGAFDPDGEQIKFNQMGWGANITPEDVIILDALQQWFR